MIKKYLAFTFSILLIFMNLPLIVFAQTSDVNDTSSTTITITLKVGYLDNYGIIKNPSSTNYEGFGYEYLNKILEYTDTNYILDFVKVDWSEGLQMLKKGELDLLAPAHYDQSRELDFIYSKHEFATDTYFLASTDETASISNSLNQLEGATIGVQKDDIINDTLKQMLKDSNISANIIETTILDYHEEIKNKSYDYFLTNSLYMIPNMSLTFNIDTSPTYLITSKDNPELMLDFDNAMQKIHDNEYLFKELLYLKYFNHDINTNHYISTEEFNLLQSQDVYNVGVVSLFDIFGYKNNSQIITTSYDVMNEIADMAGIKVNFVKLSSDYTRNDTSNLDFYFEPIGFNFISDNTKSDPYMSTPFVIIERIDSDVINENTIGVLKNYNFNQEFVDYFLPNQTIVEFDNIQALCNAFENNGVDNLFISNTYYNLTYQKFLDIDHTVKFTKFFESPKIHFNENFSDDKILIINKLLSYIDDDFILSSSLKNVAAINNHEKLVYYQTAIRMFVLIVCMALFIFSQMKKHKDESFAQLASHDELTGLLTLNNFILQTRELLDSNLNQNYSLLSVDIDNFKYINEIYNYDVGTNILKQISDSLKKYLDVNLPIAHVVADNFLIVAPTNEILSKVESFLLPNNEIINDIHQHIDEHYIVNFSIGGYNIVDSSLDIAYMIDCCNLARSFSKMELGTTFNIFSENMKEQEKIKNDIIAHMNQALIDKEFVLYYQPKFDIVSMKITGAEALVRWFSDGKMIPPNNFIPLFEKNGFIENLDYYVVERACEFISIHDKMNLPVISVNLSGITIMKRDVVDKIMEIVRRHKVRPKQLDLEITESAFVDHFESALESIDQFRELGFTISMDDFGAGISSLNRLKEISIDILKIDREFIVGSLENDKGSKIIRNIVNMAKDLKLETVAEGIETIEQLDFLRNLGCDIGQGYFFSRPLPEKDFVILIQDEDI